MYVCLTKREVDSISETYYRYQAKLKDENEIIAHHLIELTEQRTDWDFILL